MTDDRNIRGPQDNTRINIHEDHELLYWAKKFGVSQEELVAAVDAVGPITSDVANRLGKSAA